MSKSTKKLSDKDMAIVGAGPELKAQIRDCVERRCEGCRERIYLSRQVIPHAIKQAKAMGQRLVFTCWKCAQPWLSRMNREGGVVEAADGFPLSHLKEELERVKHRDIEVN